MPRPSVRKGSVNNISSAPGRVVYQADGYIRHKAVGSRAGWQRMPPGNVPLSPRILQSVQGLYLSPNAGDDDTP